MMLSRKLDHKAGITNTFFFPCYYRFHSSKIFQPKMPSLFYVKICCQKYFNYKIKHTKILRAVSNLLLWITCSRNHLNPKCIIQTSCASAVGQVLYECFTAKCSEGKPVTQPVTVEKAKCFYNEMMAKAHFLISGWKLSKMKQ